MEEIYFQDLIHYKELPLEKQIRIDHLNCEEKPGLLKIIKNYSDIFYQENSKLTFTSAIRH